MNRTNRMFGINRKLYLINEFERLVKSAKKIYVSDVAKTIVRPNKSNTKMGHKTELTNIAFRARKVDTGEWVEGNWYHNFRKGEHTSICEFGTNNCYPCYRESLQIRNHWGFWVPAEQVLFEGPTCYEDAKPENLDEEHKRLHELNGK